LTSPVSGIPSHAQKAIIGRFLGFQALAPGLSEMESKGHCDTAARLRASIGWITNEKLNDPDSQETLEEFLTTLPGRLNGELHNVTDRSRPAAQSAIEELQIIIDAYLLNPYDPLQRVTDDAARVAADYYRAFTTGMPDELWQSTFPGFSFVGGKDSAFDDKAHLQLWTEFNRSDYPAARVMVKIPPRSLDEGNIAVLPRILLHEYVAHVPQGPHSGIRVHPDADDRFAEGWMDYIAHRIFKDVLERKGPSPGFGDSLVTDWIPIHENASERFFAARCGTTNSDRVAAVRCEGARAAWQLHDLLRRLAATSDRADEYLYRLSLTLNVSQFSNAARVQFATNVRKSLLRASRVDALTVPLLEWIKGHTSSNDFFERIIDD
jgi:hypothetical protein